MSRSPRVGDTYRAARRNGSGAMPTKSPVNEKDIKLRPVPLSPWVPKAERIRLQRKLDAHRAMLKGLVQPPAASPVFGKKREPFHGEVRLSIWSGFKKLRRAANRGLLPMKEPTHKEKMAHAWYRKTQRAAS